MISIYSEQRYGIRTPEAIQIATALNGGSSKLMTNDRSLMKTQENEVDALFDIRKSIKTWATDFSR